MNTQIEWKAEVSFSGDEKEFLKFAETMSAHKLQIVVSGKPFPFPGIPQWGGTLTIAKEKLDMIIKEMPAIPVKRIGGIAGGIRVPHIHVGEHLYLLNKERFGQYLGELGRMMAASIAEETVDHVIAMERLDNMASQQAVKADLIQKIPM